MSKTVARLPSSEDGQAFVSVSALEAGKLTLPEKNFITGADPNKRTTVPSLSFLIQHKSNNGKSANIVFDLGVKRDLSGYAPAQQHHITQRQPVIVEPDAADSLKAGGFDPVNDIHVVMLSHVHWDHIGTAADFPNSRFVVGSGTLHVLKHGAGPHYPAEIFNANELPTDRTFELPPVDAATSSSAAEKQTNHQWKPFAQFPAAIDYFEDGSLYIIDTPGHITGHVNLLARVGPDRWVYLGGDCCHDSRILRGVCGIALYDDGHGGLRSVHMDTEIATDSIDLVKELKAGPDGDKVEVVIAHDKEWMEKNGHRFLPGNL